MKTPSLALALSGVAALLVTALPCVAEARIVAWGQAGDVPISADFDGDGQSDITVFRPSTGDWWTIRSSDGAMTRVQWGMSTDVPVAADYDGDGKADIAVFRAATHEWFIIRSSDGTMQQGYWGDPGDIPVPADYDGDGKADIAIWRPSTGTWWLAQTTKGIRTQQWGTAGDVPVPGQYDDYVGADFAVLRPSRREVYTLGSVTGAGRTQRLPSFSEAFVPARFFCWRDTLASFNKSTGVWTVPGALTMMYGMAGDIPMPGYYAGSDTAMGAQRAVFRPSEGKWYIHEGQEVCIN